MTRPSNVHFLIIVVAIAVVAWVAFLTFRPSPESRRALALSKLAVTSEQSRLWRQAADRKAAVGILNLSVSQASVPKRQPSTIANQPVAPRPAGIPPEVATAVRIIATADLQNADITGQATVLEADANSQRVMLDLGKGKRITFLARIAGQPLPVKPMDV